MKKYDCNKVLDCIHELRRLCDGNGNKSCEDGCPLHGYSCSPWSMTQTEINILQKWSDEHLEPPKIRKRELDFIAMFKWSDEKWIERTPGGSLRFVTKNEYCYLCDAWFSFIGKGESMTFEELLNLEVEE